MPFVPKCLQFVSSFSFTRVQDNVAHNVILMIFQVADLVGRHEATHIYTRTLTFTLFHLLLSLPPISCGKLGKGGRKLSYLPGVCTNSGGGE